MSRPRNAARRGATVARTRRLFGLFRHEQTDPDRFYTALADDSVGQLGEFLDLRGAVIVDIGSGSGYFEKAFDAAGARYVSIEIDQQHAHSDRSSHVVGSGTALPIRSSSVDLAYASNVLEHVQDAWAMADEMVRVTRSGGTVVLSFTLWWSLWGGHDTSPWHLLGGNYARRRFRRRTGHEPQHRFGETLFARTAGETIRWAKACDDIEIVSIFPRYHPSWLHWVVRVPVVRELATWNLVAVLRKR